MVEYLNKGRRSTGKRDLEQGQLESVQKQPIGGLPDDEISSQ